MFKVEVMVFVRCALIMMMDEDEVDLWFLVGWLLFCFGASKERKKGSGFCFRNTYEKESKRALGRKRERKREKICSIPFL